MNNNNTLHQSHHSIQPQPIEPPPPYLRSSKPFIMDPQITNLMHQKLNSIFPSNLPSLTTNYINRSNTPDSVISEANQTVASSISPNIIPSNVILNNMSPLPSFKINKLLSSPSSFQINNNFNNFNNINNTHHISHKKPIPIKPKQQEQESEDQDIDLSDDNWEPATNSNNKYKNNKNKKHRPKSRRQSPKPQNVKPEANGHESILWSDLCSVCLECHFCKKQFTDDPITGNGGRREYIEHLKDHYNKDKNLVYLTCELCLKQPTTKALKSKKKLMKKKNKNNSFDPDEWRKCKHVANFISHIAGHKGMKSGFKCKVKVYNNINKQYEICNTSASTQQNLSKHIYNIHYKSTDDDQKHTVNPHFGYVAKDKLKELNKSRSKKRKRSTSTSTSTKKDKEEKNDYIDNDNDAPKTKKRKLNDNIYEPPYNTNNKYKNNKYSPCFGENEQIHFVGLLCKAAAINSKTEKLIIF